MPRDLEWRRKLSESMKARGGHPCNEHTKRKVSEALKGKKRSQEAKVRQSETRKRLFAEGKLSVWNKGVPKSTFQLRGSDNPRYKERMYRDGYVYIHKPNHPNCQKTSGLILEHRFVVSEYLGRPLEVYESVHHKNAITDDNRIENLEIVVGRIHNGEVRCPHCLKIFRIR